MRSSPPPSDDVASLPSLSLRSLSERRDDGGDLELDSLAPSARRVDFTRKLGEQCSSMICIFLLLSPPSSFNGISCVPSIPNALANMSLGFQLFVIGP